MRRKLLGIALSLMLIATMIPSAVSAQETGTYYLLVQQEYLHGADGRAWIGEDTLEGNTFERGISAGETRSVGFSPEWGYKVSRITVNDVDFDFDFDEYGDEFEITVDDDTTVKIYFRPTAVDEAKTSFKVKKTDASGGGTA